MVTDKRWTRWAVLALTVGFGSCASGSSRNPFDGTPASGSQSDQIRIEVQNLHFNDATVWALRGSQRITVGRIGGKTDQNFTIDWNVAQPIGFRIDVVSGGVCETPPIIVEANSRVWVNIPNTIFPGNCRSGRR